MYLQAYNSFFCAYHAVLGFVVANPSVCSLSWLRPSQRDEFLAVFFTIQRRLTVCIEIGGGGSSRSSRLSIMQVEWKGGVKILRYLTNIQLCLVNDRIRPVTWTNRIVFDPSNGAIFSNLE